MKYREMTIGTKIVAGFAALLILILVMGITAIHGLNEVVGQSETANNADVLKRKFEAMEIQHLNWISSLGTLISAAQTASVDHSEHLFLLPAELAQWFSTQQHAQLERDIPDAEKYLAASHAAVLKLQRDAEKMNSLIEPRHLAFVAQMATLQEKNRLMMADIGRSMEEEGSRFITPVRQLKTVVQQAISVLRASERDPSLGSDDDRRRTAMTTIKHIRYGPAGKDYLWIIDTKPQMVMHPYHTELYEENLSAYHDSTGRHPFRDMVQIVKNRKNGYLFYHWPLYESYEGEEPKLSYVECFDPWYWIVGTGLYVNRKDKAMLDRIDSYLKGKKPDLGFCVRPFREHFSAMFHQKGIQEILSRHASIRQNLQEAMASLDPFTAALSTLEQRLATLDIEGARYVYRTQLAAHSKRIDGFILQAIGEEKKIQAHLDEAAALFQREILPTSDTLVVSLRNIVNLIDKKAPNSAAVMHASVAAKKRILAISFAAVFAALLCALWVSSRILRTLKAATRSLAAMNGEIMKASSDVETSKNDINNGIVKQFECISAASRSMDNVLASANRNAERATTAQGIAGETVAVVEEAAKSFSALRSSMENIIAGNRQSQAIAKMINDLNKETAILSVNASIEAAKAGGDGNGFAVIAGRIRELSLRSSESARHASLLMSSSTDMIQTGASILSDTHTAFEQVVAKSMETTSLIQIIRKASQDQAISTREIADAVTSIDAVVQDNVRAMKNLGVTTENLKERIDDLKELVNSIRRISGDLGNGRKWSVYESNTRNIPDIQPDLIPFFPASPRRG